MSIQYENNKNIESGLKRSELRTKAPRLEPPFKVYTYESGLGGRKKVVNEWICRSMTTWRMCMGIPAHLSKAACVSNEYIYGYSGGGKKDIVEMKIDNLVIYDNPIELGELFLACNKKPNTDCSCCLDKNEQSCHMVTVPPQNFIYVEERMK